MASEQDDLKAKARELMGRDLKDEDLESFGIRLPVMLRCLGTLQAWEARRLDAPLAVTYRVPVSGETLDDGD